MPGESVAVHAPLLTLYRDGEFTFRLFNLPPAMALYFTQSFLGAGLDPFTQGVENSPASGNSTIIFRPTAVTPDVLYYHATGAVCTGFRIAIEDATTVRGATGAGGSEGRVVVLEILRLPLDEEKTKGSTIWKQHRALTPLPSQSDYHDNFHNHNHNHNDDHIDHHKHHHHKYHYHKHHHNEHHNNHGWTSLCDCRENMVFSWRISNSKQTA